MRNNVNKNPACRIKFLSKKVALIERIKHPNRDMIKLILEQIYYLLTIKFENKQLKIKYSNWL